MMSYTDLYLGASGPLISGGGNPGAGPDCKPACCIFGVPFDATHSYKPGCRFGPDAIRAAFHNIEVFHPALGVDIEDVRVSDLGNMPHTSSAEQMLESVGRVAGELAGRGIPVFALGGEHLITYGTYMAHPDDVAYVVFDAHYDLRDEYGGVRLNHATYLRRVIEARKRGAKDMLHVGARAYAADEAAFLSECGMQTVSDADIRSGAAPDMVRDFTSSHDAIYLSFDLDLLDPAYAPGVGNPEAEGASSREFFDMVRAVAGSGARIVGSDIVEMNPVYDNGSTAALAAKVLSMLVAMTSIQQQPPSSSR